MLEVDVLSKMLSVW